MKSFENTFETPKGCLSSGLADYHHVIIFNDYNHDYINVIKSSFAILTFLANKIRERKHLQVNVIVFAVNSFLRAFIQHFQMGPFERDKPSRNRKGCKTYFVCKNSELICSRFNPKMPTLPFMLDRIQKPLFPEIKFCFEKNGFFFRSEKTDFFGKNGKCRIVPKTLGVLCARKTFRS